MILFFDTETTGKLDFRAPFDAPHQPRLVELAAILLGDDAMPQQTISLIVKPEGFTIPKVASDIHGISTETANRMGMPLPLVLDCLTLLMRISDATAAFNYDYDEGVLRGEYLRLGKPHEFNEPGQKPKRERFCVMLASKDHCKIPGNYDDYKWPKLQEAYEHFFKKPFDQAHEALDDVRRTAEVYFALKAAENTFAKSHALPIVGPRNETK